MNLFQKLALPVLLVFSFNQTVIACSASIPSPLEYCLYQEGFDPKTEEFKECAFKLMDMEGKEFMNRYDPCSEGYIGPPQELTGPIPLSLEKQIEEEYMKEKSYFKWIVYKYSGINLFGNYRVGF